MKQTRADKRMFLSLAAFLAAGAACVLTALPALAANPAGLTLRVRFNDNQAPAAVADLAAAPDGNVEGRVVLMWTAPGDLPGNATVAQYELLHATFPVSGSTTAWVAAASVHAPMGAYAPSAPGAPETFVADGFPGGTYYFALRSRDAAGNWSPLDALAVSGPQASAAVLSVRPAPVSGLAVDVSGGLSWSPVTLNENGSAATDVVDYAVLRSNSLMGPFNVVVSSGAGPNSFFSTLNVAPASIEYLQVVARDAAGNLSDPALTNLLEVTPQGIIGQLALAPDGTVTRSYLPSSMMAELRNETGELIMRVTPNVDPAFNRDPRTVATYDVSVVSPGQVVDKSFALSRPAMNVVLQFTPPPTGQEVGVLWWNGTSWSKVGDVEVDTITNTVSFYTSLPGTYQVRVFKPAEELTVDKNNVFPRIFSPNGDGINEDFLILVDNPNRSSMTGKIYDVAGAEIADMVPAGPASPTPDTMSWNGRNRKGELVPAGVYVYRIRGEGKTISGTMVVAK